MKTALITGASGSIGSACAEIFVKNGYFTAGTYNTGEKKAFELKRRMGENGELFYPVQADLSDYGGAQAAYDYVKNNFGHADVLVYCAGAELYKLAQDTAGSELERIMNVNFNSAYLLSSLCLKDMTERKRGSIVFVSSIWGARGASMESAYSASKAALIGLTKSLAKEAGPSGVRVNCVCPGATDTKMLARFSAEELADVIERTPLGRLGTPCEMAELIYFLASEKAGFITGQSIVADGGFIL